VPPSSASHPNGSADVAEVVIVESADAAGELAADAIEQHMLAKREGLGI